jgi:hypothetical protein
MAFGGRGDFHVDHFRMRVTINRGQPQDFLYENGAVGASPTRRMLQPEATGAAMEVTRWLKPSGSVSRIGDRARVQAVTRVNAEQA